MDKFRKIAFYRKALAGKTIQNTLLFTFIFWGIKLWVGDISFLSAQTFELPKRIPFYHYGVEGPQFSLALPGGIEISADRFFSAYPEQEGLCVVVKKDSLGYLKYGALDTLGNWVIEPRFSFIGTFSGGLAPARIGLGKSGYIDKSGNWVVHPQWEEAGEFFGTRAVVGNGDVHGVINQSGRMIVGQVYEEYYWPDATWEGGNFAMVKDAGRGWGLLNLRTLAEGVPCVWDEAKFILESGLLPVKHGKKWGFSDTLGRLRIPCHYENTEGFCNGLASVIKGTKSGFIDTNGKEIIAFEYDFASNFKEGIAITYRRDLGKYFWINHQGQILKEFSSEDFYFPGSFSEGRIRFRKKLSEGIYAWGYMDISGEEVIKPRFGECEDFHLGRAIVSGNDVYTKTLFGLIDSFGEKVTEIKYNRLYPVWGKEGLLWYCETGRSLMLTPMIDRNGVEYFKTRFTSGE